MKPMICYEGIPSCTGPCSCNISCMNIRALIKEILYLPEDASIFINKDESDTFLMVIHENTCLSFCVNKQPEQLLKEDIEVSVSEKKFPGYVKSLLLWKDDNSAFN